MNDPNATRTQKVQQKLTIRNAQKEDSPFVGRCLLAAMEILPLEQGSDTNSKDLLESVTHSCSLEDDLYSYRHARIAEIGNERVGCLISYDGSVYEPLRKITFDRLLKEKGLDLRENPLETAAGEYYLDCMVVVPSHRGNGIGLQLMQDGIELAKQKDIQKVSLLVDQSHLNLKAYYQKLGFCTTGELFAYGTMYDKMILEL